MVAGEPSGDLLAAGLLTGILRRFPTAQVRGVGGPRLRRAGLEVSLDSSLLTAMGFMEVIKGIRGHLKRLRMVQEDIQAFDPDILIPVDFPGFNLALLSRIQPSRMKIAWFISPKFWAWRYKRIHRIIRWTDRVLCIFPFEVSHYQKWGGDAVYEGHPLVDLVESDVDPICFSEERGISTDKPLITFFPGSRDQEIEKLLPVALETVSQLGNSDATFAVHLIRESLLEKWRDPLVHAGIVPLAGSSWDTMRVSNLALIASGTANLEAALLGTPQIMYYRMHPVTWQLAKRVVHLQWASPVNILLEREGIPEVIQNNLVPEIARRIAEFLNDPGEFTRNVRANYEELRQRMGEPGVFSRLADQLVPLIEGADHG